VRDIGTPTRVEAVRSDARVGGRCDIYATGAIHVHIAGTLNVHANHRCAP